MKAYLLLPLLVFFLGLGVGQDLQAQSRIRKDFTYIKITDPEGNSDGWMAGNTQVTFNVGSNNDVVIYSTNGETLYYVNTTQETEEGYIWGQAYEAITTVNADGLSIEFYVLSGGDVLMYIKDSGHIIRFSN